MKNVSIATLIVASSLGLAACNHQPGYGGGPKAGIGTVAGAVAGGVIGNQFGSGSGKVAATVAGAVLGGLIGHSIGTSLDEADRQRAMAAEYRALQYGQAGQRVVWRNPNSGYYGEVVPGPYYDSGTGRCRDYTHTIYIDGRPEVARGTACRQPDGTWATVG